MTIGFTIDTGLHLPTRHLEGVSSAELMHSAALSYIDSFLRYFGIPYIRCDLSDHFITSPKKVMHT